ncbi:unnamed protein product [Closterium sp. NIES-53]
MSFARVTVLVRLAGGFTLSTAASPGLTTLGVLSLVTTSSSLAGQVYLGIAAASLVANEFGTLPGTAPAQALHTFTLNSGASRCFFRDSTTLTPLSTPVPVRLADPSGGQVVARSSTVLPCSTVLSGSLSGLHLPSFSANLLSAAALQDAMVTTTTPGGQRVTICTCTRTGRHLAKFTRRPGSSLYTLATEPSQVAASAQVSTSGQVAASCSCRLLSHQTLLWHHRPGHPSLPRLRGMHSRLLVSGLPRSLPPLPPSPAPPCPPCVEGRQRAAPHSSLFPPTSAPLQTLHMDVWGPARVSGQSRERYFMLVVDNYTRYTTVFPLRSKGEVVDVLIPWIRTVRLQLRERFGQDLPFLRLHSDRGGEFSSNLLRDFCHGEGILQSFTLPDSPQQNGIAERRIGLVMEVARTSMIHAAAPHFMWPFAVRYAAHQLNLWPHVSFPETLPTLRWTGEVGDTSVFRVWGSRAFVCDTSADKLSPRAIPCIFLGFVPDAPGWQFYHPTSRRVFPSQDVTFDESVPFYRLFPYCSAPSPPPPLVLAPGPPPIDPLPPQGPAPSGMSQVDPLLGPAPVQVVVGSGAARGAGSGGDSSGGAEPGGAESEGAETGGLEPEGVETRGGELVGAAPKGVEPGGGASEGAESIGAEPQGAASSGGSAGDSLRVSPQQLHEWFVWRARLRSGSTGAGSAGAAGAGGIGVAAGAGVPGGTAATGPGGTHTRGTGAAGTGGVEGARARDPTESGATAAGGSGAGRTGAGGEGVGGTGIGGAGVGGTGVGGPGAGGDGAADRGGAVRWRPYFVPLLQQVLPTPYSTSLTPPLLCPPPAQSQSPLQPASLLPAPSPYTEQTGGLTERREPSSRPVSPICTARRVPRSCPPPVPGTHAMTLRPSSVPLRVPLPTPPESSLPEVPDPESDRARITTPAVSCLLAIAVTDPSFESAATSALIAELLDFAAACRLDYATALVADSASHSPPSIGEAITDPYCSQWQAVMDIEMASWKSTSTYVDEVTPPGANIVDGMWIFRVKRMPGSPPAFKARYVARGFIQRQGVDYFHTFSPTPKMTTLRVLLHVAAQRDYELHSLDFSTTFLQGSLHEEIWLRHPPGFTESFPAGTQWSLRRLANGLRQAPRKWHDTLRTTLAALGFSPTTADPSLFLRTDTLLPPFYVLVHVDDLIFATADTEALTLVKSKLSFSLSASSSPHHNPLLYLLATRSQLHLRTSPTLGMGLVLGGWGPVVLTGHADASWVGDSATQRSSHGYTFSLGSGFVSWRCTRSSSVLSSSCAAEIYAGAMAAQELRWLPYLLTDLGEQPRSPPVLYVDNKAMIALCQEHRLEQRTKHIALQYFLARELQQRGQLRLAYVATRANTADILTKALLPGDHQRFSTVLGLLALLFLTGLVTTCSPPLCLWGLRRSAKRGGTGGAGEGEGEGEGTSSTSLEAGSPTSVSRGSVAVEVSVGGVVGIRPDAGPCSDFHTSSDMLSLNTTPGVVTT